MLSDIDTLIHVRYVELMAKQGQTAVTAHDVKNAFQGIATTQETLVRRFAEHNEEYAKRVGVDRTQGTLNTYCDSLKHVRGFVKTKYRLDDIPLRSLAPSFIDEFDHYLRYDKRLANGTVNRMIWPLRKIVRCAVSEGLSSHIMNDAMWRSR